MGAGRRLEPWLVHTTQFAHYRPAVYHPLNDFDVCIEDVLHILVLHILTFYHNLVGPSGCLYGGFLCLPVVLLQACFQYVWYYSVAKA